MTDGSLVERKLLEAFPGGAALLFDHDLRYRGCL